MIFHVADFTMSLCSFSNSLFLLFQIKFSFKQTTKAKQRMCSNTTTKPPCGLPLWSRGLASIILLGLAQVFHIVSVTTPLIVLKRDILLSVPNVPNVTVLAYNEVTVGVMKSRIFVDVANSDAFDQDRVIDTKELPNTCEKTHQMADALRHSSPRSGCAPSACWQRSPFRSGPFRSGLVARHDYHPIWGDRGLDSIPHLGKRTVRVCRRGRTVKARRSGRRRRSYLWLRFWSSSRGPSRVLPKGPHDELGCCSSKKKTDANELIEADPKAMTSWR